MKEIYHEVQIFDGLNQFFSYGFFNLIKKNNIKFVQNLLSIFSNDLYNAIKQQKILYIEQFERFCSEIEKLYKEFKINVIKFYEVKTLILLKNKASNHY